MGRPVAKRTVCKNNILVNDPDYQDGLACCKEGILVLQSFFANNPDHTDKKNLPGRIVDETFVLQMVQIIQLLIIPFIQRERLLVGKALCAGNVSDHPNGLACCKEVGPCKIFGDNRLCGL